MADDVRVAAVNVTGRSFRATMLSRLRASSRAARSQTTAISAPPKALS